MRLSLLKIIKKYIYIYTHTYLNLKFQKKQICQTKSMKFIQSQFNNFNCIIDIVDWSGYYLGNRKSDPVLMKLFIKTRWELLELGFERGLEGVCVIWLIGYNWLAVLFFKLILFCFNHEFNKAHRGSQTFL